MKRKTLYYFETCLLTLQMFFLAVIPCRAAEIDSGASLSARDGYRLQADKSQLNFGSLAQGSLASGQNIILTNNGQEELELLWHESDYHDCITVDAPADFALDPGESCTFAITPNTSLPPGTYNTFLLFGDLSDPYFENGVQVDISLKITNPAPVITSISISPGTVVVSKNSTCAFTASVSGQNNYSREVAWNVTGQTSGNTFIDSRGVLNIGSDERASYLIVKAVSRQDSAYSATAMASLQKSSYFVQVDASPDNGGTVHGGGAVEEGGYAVINASPNSGFAFDGWYLDGSRVSQNSQYVADNIRSNRTYTAVFHPINCHINVNVNNGNAGTASESKTVPYGQGTTLEATAKDGYQFDGWMENGSIISTDSRMSLQNITASREFTAMFSQNKYTLSLTCSPVNTGTLSGQGTYEQGSNVRIKATPAGGYRFVAWVENGNIVSTDAEYSVNAISRDMHFVASFEPERAVSYTINASSTSSGTIAPEGKTKIPEGSGILYTIAPKSGYVVSAVYVDGTPVGAVSSYRFTDVREDHEISVDFAALPGQNTDTTTPDTPSEPPAPVVSAPDSRKDIDTIPEQEPTDENDGGTQTPDASTDSSTDKAQSPDDSVQTTESPADTDNDRKFVTDDLHTNDVENTETMAKHEGNNKISTVIAIVSVMFATVTTVLLLFLVIRRRH